MSDSELPGYKLGVPPKAKFNAFQTPQLKYLNVIPEAQRRNAWQYDWSRPKAILPKVRVRRGHWRIAAFADSVGITCHTTFHAVWPKSDQYDEVLLAAILNSPVANAFVASREGSRDVTGEVLRLIPVPKFSRASVDNIHDLVRQYEDSVNNLALGRREDAELLLKSIDAAVLDAYRMPPQLERLLLDYFNDNERKVDHPFRNYFPASLDIYLHLSEYLSRKFNHSTVGELLKKIAVR